MKKILILAAFLAAVAVPARAQNTTNPPSQRLGGQTLTTNVPGVGTSAAPVLPYPVLVNVYYGTNQPNGSVTATLGAVYYQYTGTNLVAQWVHQGTGNTNWLAATNIAAGVELSSPNSWTAVQTFTAGIINSGPVVNTSSVTNTGPVVNTGTVTNSGAVVNTGTTTSSATGTYSGANAFTSQGNQITASNVYVGNTFTSPRTEANLSQSLKNIPYRGLNTYYSFNFSPYNGFSSSTNVLMAATNLIGSGLINYGYNTIVIDIGWCHGRDPATGLLTYATNDFPNGVAPVIAQLHKMGLKVVLFDCYLSPNGVSPVVPMFNEEPIDSQDLSNDMTMFASWNIDGLIFSENGVNIGQDAIVRSDFENFSYWARKIIPTIPITEVDQASTNVDYVYATPANFNTIDPLTGYYFSNPIWNARSYPWLVDDYDYGYVGTEYEPNNEFIARYIGNFVNVQNLAGYWNSNRHPFVNAMANWASPYDYSGKNGKEQMTLWSLEHAPLIMGDAWQFWDSIGSSLTNAACLKIQTDSAYNNPVPIGTIAYYNNGTNQFGTNVDVWEEPLSDGSMALAVINYNTNQAQTLTIPLLNTNYGTNLFGTSYSTWIGTNNEVFFEQDAWKGDYSETASYPTNVPPNNTYVSNSITMTIGTNDCFLIMLYPVPTTGIATYSTGNGNTVTVGSSPNVVTNGGPAYLAGATVLTNNTSTGISIYSPALSGNSMLLSSNANVDIFGGVLSVHNDSRQGNGLQIYARDSGYVWLFYANGGVFNLLDGGSGNLISVTQAGNVSLPVANSIFTAPQIASTGTNTLVVTATGVTNGTSANYLVSITAGTGMAVKNVAGGTTYLSPIAGDTFFLHPGGALTGTGITGIASQ